MRPAATGAAAGAEGGGRQAGRSTGTKELANCLPGWLPGCLEGTGAAAVALLAFMQAARALLPEAAKPTARSSGSQETADYHPPRASGPRPPLGFMAGVGLTLAGVLSVLLECVCAGHSLGQALGGVLGVDARARPVQHRAAGDPPTARRGPARSNLGRHQCLGHSQQRARPQAANWQLTGTGLGRWRPTAAA
jgi:hypothetical protein